MKRCSGKISTKQLYLSPYKTLELNNVNNFSTLILFQSQAILNKGDNADYICNVIGHPKPEITWFMNNRPIKRSRYSYPLPISTEYGSKLVLVSASEKNQGELTCSAENQNSKDLQSINIQITSELFELLLLQTISYLLKNFLEFLKFLFELLLPG